MTIRFKIVAIITGLILLIIFGMIDLSKIFSPSEPDSEYGYGGKESSPPSKPKVKAYSRIITKQAPVMSEKKASIKKTEKSKTDSIKLKDTVIKKGISSTNLGKDYITKSIIISSSKKISTKPYKGKDKWYQPLADAKEFRQLGIASWYGKKFHGKKTSNHEIYNMYSMTAAHKTLPFNTIVKVVNLNNKKEIKVKINDRGPFVRGRIIDLSYSGAKKLGIIKTGTAPVEIFALGLASNSSGKNSSDSSYIPIDYYSGNFTFQVGAFKNRENAHRLKTQLLKDFKHVKVVPPKPGISTLYRVRVGKCTTLKQAVDFENILIKKGFNDVFTIAE